MFIKWNILNIYYEFRYKISVSYQMKKATRKNHIIIPELSTTISYLVKKKRLTIHEEDK